MPGPNMDTTGRAGLVRAFEVAEQLARETHEEQSRARQRTSKTDRPGRWRALPRSRSSSTSGGAFRTSESGSDATGESPLVNSPWFTTVLGPPFLAECRWRWTFGPDGWEATQVRIARGERWVEVEWCASETEGNTLIMAHNGDLERGGNHEHLGDGLERNDALQKIRTAGSISISPELFEKIYLSPQNKVKGDLRKTFGNPTPIALVGFLLSLSPLSCDLLGWRGAGGNGAASTGAYFGFGCILMLLGGIFELLLGNTFPAVVFTSFGAFWFTFGATLTPAFAAISSYEATGGAESPVFAASFGFFTLWMCFLCFIYLICSVRTNIVFMLIFLSLVLGFGMLTGSYWAAAQGMMSMSNTLLMGGAGSVFCTHIFGWYIFFAQMLASVDFPIQIPVGDLSGMIKGASDRAKAD